MFPLSLESYAVSILLWSPWSRALKLVSLFIMAWIGLLGHRDEFAKLAPLYSPESIGAGDPRSPRRPPLNLLRPEFGSVS